MLGGGISPLYPVRYFYQSVYEISFDLIVYLSYLYMSLAHLLALVICRSLSLTLSLSLSLSLSILISLSFSLSTFTSHSLPLSSPSLFLLCLADTLSIHHALINK